VAKPDQPSPAKPRLVRCPACGGESVYALTNPFRPFCSERCRNMDLGAWASEEFRVPEKPPREEE
jgi:endogenous inhibitor of DNA gyrase (YacG/DUF329 family)